MSNDERIQFNNGRRIQHSHMVMACLMAYDAVAVSFAFLFALLLRFDFEFTRIPIIYLQPWEYFTPFYVIICLAVFWRFRLYKSIWRFASFTELERIIVATAITAIIHIIGITIAVNMIASQTIYTVNRMPLSYYITGIIVQFILITAIRFSYRFVLLLRSTKNKSEITPVMVFGAGSASTLTIREIRRNDQLKEDVACIIDDNPNKWNRDIDGVPIVGGRKMIPEAVEKYGIKKIYIAVPSISSKERKRIIDICKDTGCELKTLPGVYQLMLGNVTVNSFRNVDVEDLLGREPVKMGSKELREYLAGKTVLVTGGGGSIGSELCRQVASAKTVKQLIVFDIYENNAHAIKLELMDKYPELNLVVLIGSVRNSRRVKEVFDKYRPDVVFHAAAHKHVPLMEDSPCEAIKNNTIGTYYTAFAAMAYGCEKFVLISTDKAVNPVNIMGASKRLCEMIVQMFARKVEEGKASDLPDLHADTGTNPNVTEYIMLPDDPKTEFVAVRFGNVLGSNGSVIPRFREQIAKGGVGLILRAT